MRTFLVGLVVLMLVPVAAPRAPEVDASCPCITDLTMNGLGGDTFAFKINPVGAGMNMFSPTFFRITGFYGQPTEDAAVMIGWASVPFANPWLLATAIATTGDGDVNVEIVSDMPMGVQYDLDDNNGAFGSVTFQLNIGGEVHFNDADWYFVLSVPEAIRLNVRVHLDHNKASLPVLATATSATGVVGPLEDFDGTAQASVPGSTTSVAMAFEANAPAGHRAFGMLMPINDEVGAAWYEIDGPAGSDDTTITPLGVPPEPAAVLSGAPGAYTFTVQVESVYSGDPVSGHAAVFAAPRMPL